MRKLTVWSQKNSLFAAFPGFTAGRRQCHPSVEHRLAGFVTAARDHGIALPACQQVRGAAPTDSSPRRPFGMHVAWGLIQ